MPVSKHGKGFKANKAKAKIKNIENKKNQLKKLSDMLTNLNAQYALEGSEEIRKQITEEAKQHGTEI